MTTWLLVDVSCLAYRSLHTTGMLSHGGRRTGVLYGIFRDILTLREEFSTDRMAFCFDRGRPKRLELYPDYKAKRRGGDPGAAEARQELRGQLRDLHDRLLPEIGFRNVFSQPGYEADDLLASLVLNLPVGHDAILISADQDLYQLLGPRVSCWSPMRKQTLTLEGFRNRYGIEPALWSTVKALAGCSSDNIQGVRGVGEKTAIAYVQGKLKPGRLFDAIVTSIGSWEKNLQLVELPFAGTNPLELQDDRVNRKSWTKVMKELGIRSLRL